jgi:hypothetical protein
LAIGAAVAVLLGSSSAALAATPSVNAPTCSPVDLVLEHGASDITTGTVGVYRPNRDSNHALSGGGAFTFTFVLADKTCSDLTYRVDVLDAIDDSPLVSGTAAADPTTNRISATVTVPNSYVNKRVNVVAQTVNGLSLTVDRAPDSGSVEICAVDDNEGCSQNFR